MAMHTHGYEESVFTVHVAIVSCSSDSGHADEIEPNPRRNEGRSLGNQGVHPSR